MTGQRQVSALDQAMRLLAGRPHSEKELAAKLAARGHSGENIAAAVRRLVEIGYLNDADYIARWAGARLQKTNLGPAKLRVELARKGFAPELIEKTVEELYHEPDAEYRAAAKAAAKKLRTLKPGLEPETVKAKIYGHLTRKGFDADTARKVALDGLEDLMEHDL